MPGDHAGLLLSGAGNLSKNVTILSNKPWSNRSQGQGQKNFSSAEEASARESKSHGFLTLTFTR